MILKGSQRGGGKQLAVHLLNVAENEHVHIHEMRGFVSDDLPSAFHEAYAVSKGTRATQFLFSLSLNPPPKENVSTEDFERAIDTVEQRLGLEDQPRAIVFHEKEGRRHAHAVWSRIAYFSDRGRPFQADRGRRIEVVVAALGKRARTGMTVAESSTISLKRMAADTAVIGFV